MIGAVWGELTTVTTFISLRPTCRVLENLNHPECHDRQHHPLEVGLAKLLDRLERLGSYSEVKGFRVGSGIGQSPWTCS